MIIDPLNDGISSVELLDHMGGDLSIVNAARVSYDKVSESFSAKDVKLITYLMKNKHGSPFEHVSMTFRVKAPLFVVQQWERHRMASYNEESGRYIELKPEFYVRNNSNHGLREALFNEDYNNYKLLLAAGETKEQARDVLPLSLYKTYWFTVNARSLMNFLMTRNDKDAQEEIRKYAQALESFFGSVFPNTLSAFEINGRVAP